MFHYFLYVQFISINFNKLLLLNTLFGKRKWPDEIVTNGLFSSTGVFV